jgi:hypothetical protein
MHGKLSSVVISFFNNHCGSLNDAVSLLLKALRTNEGNEAQVCFFIIHLLMLKPPEFRNRIIEFVKDNSPEHWKQSNW